MPKKETFTTDLRCVLIDETEHYDESWREENEIEKISQAYLYDKNRITRIASFQGNHWLESLFRYVSPNEDDQQDALDDSNQSDSSYYNTGFSSEEEVTLKEQNFSYSSDEEYDEKFEDVKVHNIENYCI